MHHAFPYDELRSLKYVHNDARTIRSTATKIVRDLVEVFSDPDVRQDIRLIITPVDASDGADVYATLASPLGLGRLVLEWTSRELSGGEWELVGVLTTERSVRNAKSELEWQQVWAINIPKTGEPWMGAGEDVSYLKYSKQLGHDKADSLYFAGLAMVYTIGTGKRG